MPIERVDGDFPERMKAIGRVFSGGGLTGEAMLWTKEGRQF